MNPFCNASSKFLSSIDKTRGSLRYFDRRRSWEILATVPMVPFAMFVEEVLVWRAVEGRRGCCGRD